eukprot:NODE_238_length_11959_cov_0.380270.p9 type:complete len:113 gc:universal NODE_238_length_11959_cov_0.380270:4885-5223(+)
MLIVSCILATLTVVCDDSRGTDIGARLAAKALFFQSDKVTRMDIVTIPSIDIDDVSGIYYKYIQRGIQNAKMSDVFIGLISTTPETSSGTMALFRYFVSGQVPDYALKVENC